MRDASGKDFLTALAVAYQVQTRLSDVAPVRDKGFDHTTHGAYAAAARILGSQFFRGSATTSAKLDAELWLGF